MKNLNNLTGIWPNLARVYEIAKLGGFSITVTYEKNGDYPQVNTDYQSIKIFYNRGNFEKDGDLWIGLVKPRTYDLKGNYETLDDIHARVEKAKKHPLPKSVFDAYSEELLKTAIQRLNFSIKDVEIIHKVAPVIAQLDLDSKIQAHHVAEAIQYRIKFYHDDELIVADNSVLYFGKYIAIDKAGLDYCYIGDEKRNIRKAIYYLKKLL